MKNLPAGTVVKYVKVWEEDVLRAGIEWWRRRRPVGWTRAQHLENPTVNTLTPVEKRLALAVSKLVRKTIWR